jgi:hypothetical protein
MRTLSQHSKTATDTAYRGRPPISWPHAASAADPLMVTPSESETSDGEKKAEAHEDISMNWKWRHDQALLHCTEKSSSAIHRHKCTQSSVALGRIAHGIVRRIRHMGDACAACPPADTERAGSGASE